MDGSRDVCCMEAGIEGVIGESVDSIPVLMLSRLAKVRMNTKGV